MATVGKEDDKQHKVYIQRDRNGLYGLHVSNISPEINELDLRSLFQSSGFIRVCKIIKTMENVRVAFIKFANYDEAAEALKKTHGAKFGGSFLDVRPAYESQKLRGNKQYREKANSSEKLSKAGLKDVKSDWNGSEMAGDNRSTSPKDKTNEKKLEEQESTKEPNITNDAGTSQNGILYVLPSASQDVRHSNSNSNVNSPTTNSSDKSYGQNPMGSRTAEMAVASSNSLVYSSGNTQNSTGLKVAHTVMTSKISPALSAGNWSQVKSYSGTQNLPMNKPRGTENVKNYRQNGPHYPEGMNKTYSQSLTNTSKTDSPYKMQNGLFSSERNPIRIVSKTMQDLEISGFGVPFNRSDVMKWSVAEVVKYFDSQEECSRSMVAFLEEQEIDGNALMLLEQDSLLHFMKLGPALKLLNLREKLKNM